jgi:hypothetical protein
MGHDLHARHKFDAVDVQPGLGRVAEQRRMLRCSGKPFVDNILWKLNNAGVSVLSVSGSPQSGSNREAVRVSMVVSLLERCK